MNKKGFTLIELLAVIVILGIIALITTYTVNSIMEDARNSLSDSQKNNIEEAAKTYYLKEGMDINDRCVSVDELIEKGYIEKSEVLDPKDREKMTGYVKITYVSNQYSYKYQENSCKIVLKGLTPVKYNGTSWVVTTSADKEWYNYEKLEWANAVILNDGVTKKVGDTLTVPTSTSTTSDVKAMFVWIPRYEYKIEGDYGKGGTSTDLPGEIEIKFIPKSQTTASEGYRIHPAFTFGTEQLEGIWVGKFETSHTTLSSSTTDNNLGCTNESCTNADGLRILPNVVSLRYNNVSNMFFAVRSMTRSGNGFGLNSNEVNSHMMKNSEWGAVAYLSQSKYGKYGNSNYTGANKEIYQNKSTSFITGNSNGTPLQSTTNTQCTYDNTTNNCGVGASTTGNITGIYDMSGGAYEYVMGIFANSNGDLWSGFDTTYNSGFTGKVGSSGTDYTGVSFPDSKYYDVYKATTGTSISSTTACNGGICYGHALSETSGWYGVYNAFVGDFYPWFSRGGGYDSGAAAGVFYFSANHGGSNSNYSFRAVLS